MTPRAWSMLAVWSLAVLPAVMLYPLWTNPTSAGEDDVLYYYPLRVQVGQSLASGEWPMHDPLVATGTPVFGDPQAAVLFPTTWLFAVWPPKLAYAVSIFVAFAVAGLGMWTYLRTLRLCRPAAWMGAVAFMFCGFLVGHRVHLSLLQAAAFLPWGLTALELLRSNRLRGFLLLVPAAALLVLGGHWPTAIHVAMIWAAYVLFRVRPFWRGMAVVAAAGILVLLICWPQLQATLEVMQQVTRGKIGYAMAGENSYFPAAAVLWLFPFLMGSRTPNFYPQSWWGPWHLCEMLGYVGLVTLVLAGAAMWRLFRKPKAGQPDSPWRPVVRTWTWMSLGALVFMLGYYLPTYRLVHMLPVLGVMRCPARMILALDVAAATLAAVTMHTVITNSARVGAVRQAVRRGATRVLPIAMLAALVLVWIGGLLGLWLWSGGYPMPFVGGPGDALMSLLPWRPAVFVPVILLVATAAGLTAWLAEPKRRVWLLMAVLVMDLFTVTQWLDVPAPNVAGPDPQRSPAARWLKIHGGESGEFHVWGLGDPYGHRQPELLLARTNTVHDIPTISTYGPFQSAAHAHLLGFQIYGTNTEWRRLIRENFLISAYGVRYLLAEEGSEYANYIESIVRKGAIHAYRLRSSPRAQFRFGVERTADVPGENRAWSLQARRAETGIAEGGWRSPQDGACNPRNRAVDSASPERATPRRKSLAPSGLSVWWPLSGGLRHRLFLSGPFGANIATTRPGSIGRNLLAENRWQLSHAEELTGGGFSLSTPFMWMWSQASQPVMIQDGETYCLQLVCRAPEGAANFLQAEVLRFGQSGGYVRPADSSLVVHPERIGEDWRRFQLVFRAGSRLAGEATLRVFTMSERPIEVRDIKLGQWSAFPPLAGPAGPPKPVYRPVAICSPVRPEDPPIIIYENEFWTPETPPTVPMTPQEVEHLRWSPQLLAVGKPDVGLRVSAERSPGDWLHRTTLPAVAAWLGVGLAWCLRRRYFLRRRGINPGDQNAENAKNAEKNG